MMMGSAALITSDVPEDDESDLEPDPLLSPPLLLPLPEPLPVTMLPSVLIACEVRAFVVLNASARAALATFEVFWISDASCAAPVSALSKSFWLAAAWPIACNRPLFGCGAVSTLLIRLGRPAIVLGAVRLPAIDGVVVGRDTGDIVGAVSAGESCQFQNRVRSIFSAEEQWPSTASPSTPRVGSE